MMSNSIIHLLSSGWSPRSAILSRIEYWCTITVTRCNSTPICQSQPINMRSYKTKYYSQDFGARGAHRKSIRCNVSVSNRNHWISHSNFWQRWFVTFSIYSWMAFIAFKMKLLRTIISLAICAFLCKGVHLKLIIHVKCPDNELRKVIAKRYSRENYVVKCSEPMKSKFHWKYV